MCNHHPTMKNLVFHFALSIILFSSPSFAQIKDGEDVQVKADYIKVLSKTDQKQRFPLVNDSTCIGVFYHNQLQGCIWGKLINLTPRLQIFKKIKFEDWDDKKVKDFYDIYTGVTHRILLIGNYTFAKHFSSKGIILKYKAVESVVSIGYHVEVGAATFLPNLLKKFPMELPGNATLIKSN